MSKLGIVIIIIIVIAGLFFLLGNKRPTDVDYSDISVDKENGHISISGVSNINKHKLQLSDYQEFIRDSVLTEGQPYELDMYSIGRVRFVEELKQIEVAITDPVNIGARNPTEFIVWSNLDGSNKRIIYYRGNSNVGGYPNVAPGGNYFAVTNVSVSGACHPFTTVSVVKLEKGQKVAEKSIDRFESFYAFEETEPFITIKHGDWFGEEDIEIIISFYSDRCSLEKERAVRLRYNLETDEYTLISGESE